MLRIEFLKYENLITLNCKDSRHPKHVEYEQLKNP